MLFCTVNHTQSYHRQKDLIDLLSSKFPTLALVNPNCNSQISLTFIPVLVVIKTGFTYGKQIVCPDSLAMKNSFSYSQKPLLQRHVA